MPQPKYASVHVDSAIRDVAIAYRNSFYIAGEVFPNVPVRHRSDVYYKFDKGDWFRDQADNDRRPGTRASRGGWNVTNETYTCKQISFAQGVPDLIVENADDVVRPFENATDFVMEQIMIRRERRLAADIFATGVWGTDVVGGTGTDLWSDFANGDPPTDIETAKDTILQNTGRLPNTLVIGRGLLKYLKLHPDALDRFKHTQTGILSNAQIAEWLEIERLLVGQATYNSAKEGQAASMSFIWGNSALLAYIAPSPGIDVPSAGYTFSFQDVNTKTFREEAEAQDVVEANVNIDMKVCGSDFGYYFSNMA